jgi:hypothetical protein
MFPNHSHSLGRNRCRLSHMPPVPHASCPTCRLSHMQAVPHASCPARHYSDRRSAAVQQTSRKVCKMRTWRLLPESSRISQTAACWISSGRVAACNFVMHQGQRHVRRHMRSNDKHVRSCTRSASAAFICGALQATGKHHRNMFCDSHALSINTALSGMYPCLSA